MPIDGTKKPPQGGVPRGGKGVSVMNFVGGVT